MSHTRQFVNFYSIKIKKRYTDSYLDYSQLDGSNSEFPDVFSFLLKCFSALKGKEVKDDKAKTTTGVSDLDKDPKKRRVWGMISHGTYGLRGTLLDLDNNSKSAIKRSHSPMYQLYFNVFLPKNGERAILALHLRGKHGCKGALTAILRDNFKAAYPELNLHISPINVSFEDRDSFFSTYFVKKIKIVTFEPKRLDERVRTGGGKPEEKVTVERIVHGGRGGSDILRFTDFVKNPVQATRKCIKRYVEIPDTQDGVQLHVTIDMDGQEKTIRLDKEKPEFDVSLDFTEELAVDQQIDPSMEALHEACTTLLNDAIKNVIGE